LSASAILLAALSGCQQQESPPDEVASAKPAEPASIENDLDGEMHTVHLPAAKPGEPVTLGAAVFPHHAQAGGTVRLVIRARMDIGWHIAAVNQSGTSAATTLEVTPPPGVEPVADWQVPPPEHWTGSTGSALGYAGDVQFERQYTIAADQLPGKLQFTCKVRYQACNDQQCVRPDPVELKPELEVLSR
jgi:hypothetical protein